MKKRSNKDAIITSNKSTIMLMNKIQEIETELDEIMEEVKELTYKNPSHTKKIEETRKKLMNLENKVLKL